MAFVSPTPISVARFTAGTATSPLVRPVVPRRTQLPARMSVGTPIQPVYKQALLERLEPLNFGRAIADNRKEQDEIEKLIRQVEATNKSVSPASDPNLNGVWSMIYTTSASILAAGRPNIFQASRIEQTLDAPTLTARNEEAFKFGPFEITNAVDAKLSPESSKRFHVNFVEFQVAGIFKFNVEKNSRFSGWLEVTYLDEDMRISRGHKGNVFVLVKK